METAAIKRQLKLNLVIILIIISLSVIIYKRVQRFLHTIKQR